MRSKLTGSSPVGRAVVEAIESRLLMTTLDGTEANGLPADEKQKLYAWIGDHSSSNSESYNMLVGSKSISAGIGIVTRDDREYKRGETYPISVTHTGTNRTGGPDWDYRAWVARLANTSWTDGQTKIGDLAFDSLAPDAGFFVVDNQQLMQKRYFGDPKGSDPVAGKSASLVLPKIDLDVDSDHSGVIYDSNGDFSELTDNVQDDIAENEPSQAAIVTRNRGDLDGDNIDDDIDYNGTFQHFTPMKLRLSSNLSLANPSAINLSFDFDGAALRIWKKDGTSARSLSNDVIPTTGSVTAQSLGLTPGGEVTLYVEGIGTASGALQVKVQVDVVGAAWSGKFKDSVYVRTVNLTFDKSYSDQFAGSTANSITGKPSTADDLTGGSNYPYILMGTRANGSANARAEVTATNLAGMSSLFTFAFIRYSKLQTNFTAYTPDYTYANGVASTTEPITSSGSSRPNEHYVMVAALDRNNDGQLSKDEVVYRGPTFQVVAPLNYADANAELNLVRDYWDLQSYYISSNWMFAFQNNIGLGLGAINSPSTVVPNEPRSSHNVGALYTTATAIAPANFADFPPTSFVGTAVSNSPELDAVAKGSLVDYLPSIKKYFRDNPSDYSVVFQWTPTATDISFNESADLYYSVHAAHIDYPTMYASIQRSGSEATNDLQLDASSYQIVGSVSDLYDFDYSAPGFAGQPVFAAASLQAGYGTLGVGGHIFKFMIEFDRTSTEQIHLAGDPPTAPRSTPTYAPAYASQSVDRRDETADFLRSDSDALYA